MLGGPGTGGIVYAIPLMLRIGKAVSKPCRSTAVRALQKDPNQSENTEEVIYRISLFFSLSLSPVGDLLSLDSIGKIFNQVHIKRGK